MATTGPRQANGSINPPFLTIDQAFECMCTTEAKQAPERTLRRLGCKNRILTSLRTSIGYRSFGRKFASAASKAGP